MAASLLRATIWGSGLSQFLPVPDKEYLTGAWDGDQSGRSASGFRSGRLLASQPFRFRLSCRCLTSSSHCFHTSKMRCAPRVVDGYPSSDAAAVLFTPLPVSSASLSVPSHRCAIRSECRLVDDQDIDVSRSLLNIGKGSTPTRTAYFNFLQGQGLRDIDNLLPSMFPRHIIRLGPFILGTDLLHLPVRCQRLPGVSPPVIVKIEKLGSPSAVIVSYDVQTNPLLRRRHPEDVQPYDFQRERGSLG